MQTAVLVYLALVYLGIVAITSLISFVAYGWDKSRAKHGGRRIPEQTLHLLALCGGWPGAMLAQRTFRHKTQKTSFRVGFWLTVILHCGIVGVASYQALNYWKAPTTEAESPIVITPLKRQ